LEALLDILRDLAVAALEVVEERLEGLRLVRGSAQPCPPLREFPASTSAPN